jgi:hypothetical protein
MAAVVVVSRLGAAGQTSAPSSKLAHPDARVRTLNV